MQFLAYLTPFNYIPACKYAAEPKWYYIFSAIFFVVTVIDYWAFYFHPLQKSIFLDQ